MKDIIGVASRVAVGGVFVCSGAVHALRAPLEAVYITEAFKIVPSFIAYPAAYILPFLEIYFGLFIMLGLFLRFSGVCAAAALALSEVIMCQAWLRALPVVGLKCFGPFGVNSFGMEFVQNLALLFLLYPAVSGGTEFTLDSLIKKWVMREARK